MSAGARCRGSGRSCFRRSSDRPNPKVVDRTAVRHLRQVCPKVRPQTCGWVDQGHADQDSIVLGTRNKPSNLNQGPFSYVAPQFYLLAEAPCIKYGRTKPTSQYARFRPLDTTGLFFGSWADVSKQKFGNAATPSLKFPGNVADEV